MMVLCSRGRLSRHIAHVSTNGTGSGPVIVVTVQLPILIWPYLSRNRLEILIHTVVGTNLQYQIN